MIPNISGSTSQTASSGATGGSYDAQGKYSFGGINTGGGTQSYVAMAVLAVVALAAIILALKK